MTTTVLHYVQTGTPAGGDPCRKVDSVQGLVVQGPRCRRGFIAETSIFLTKTVAVLWLSLERINLAPMGSHACTQKVLEVFD